MVSRRRSAIATLAGSSATTLVAALQSLVLLPLYLSEIGVGLYGAWLATGEVLVWLLAFDFGIPNLLIQRSGAHLAKGEKRKIGEMFTTSLVALVALALALFLLVWGASPFLPGWFGIHGSDAAQLSRALLLGGAATGTMIVAYGFVGLARGMQDTVAVQTSAFVGTVVGFVLTAWLLFDGHGLLAIALGLVVRSAFTLFGGIAFVALRLDPDVRRALAPTREAAKDILAHCPPMFAAGIGYALMNNSMVTMAAVMVRPEVATVLGVTRKVADLGKVLLDMVGHATYGGFAHLFASGDARRATSTYREVQATFFLLAISMLGAYVAVNGPLVSLWVGPEMYGGAALTVALALALGAASWSYLQIGLYRSTGYHAAASHAILAECAARLVLMVVGGYAFGLIGFAVATVVTSLVSGIWASKRLRSVVAAGEPAARPWVMRALPFVLCAVVGAIGLSVSWSSVIVTAALCGLATVLLLLFTDPALGSFRRKLVGGGA